MPLHDLSTNSQAHSRPFVVLAAMQTLKQFENSIEINFLEPDPVVAHADFAERDLSVLRAIIEEPALHLYDRGGFRSGEFQTIANEILNQLAHLQRIGFQRRQRTDLDPSAHPLDLIFQIGQNILGRSGKIHHTKGCALVVTREKVSSASIRLRIRAAEASILVR